MNQSIISAQIEQCYRQLRISLVFNLVNGIFLIGALWGATNTAALFGWAFLLIAVTDARYLTLRAFEEALQGEQLNHDTWRRYFVIGACAAGVVWGAAGALLFHSDSLPHQVFLAFVLGGMVAGAVPLL
jgi:hypothetical protein